MLRHTYVTTMLDAGVDLRDVQIAARHADPRTAVGGPLGIVTCGSSSKFIHTIQRRSGAVLSSSRAWSESDSAA